MDEREAIERLADEFQEHHESFKNAVPLSRATHVRLAAMAYDFFEKNGLLSAVSQSSEGS